MFSTFLRTTLLALSLPSLFALVNAKGGGGKGGGKGGGTRWVGGTSDGGGGSGEGLEGWKVAVIVIGCLLGVFIFCYIFRCCTRPKPLSEAKPKSHQTSFPKDLEAGRNLAPSYTGYPHLQRLHENYYLSSSTPNVLPDIRRPDRAYAKPQLCPPPSPHPAYRGSWESAAYSPSTCETLVEHAPTSSWLAALSTRLSQIPANRATVESTAQPFTIPPSPSSTSSTYTFETTSSKTVA